MSQTIPAGLQAKLDTGGDDVSYIHAITRLDGTVKRLTNWDKAVTFGGNSYLPNVIAAMSDISMESTGIARMDLTVAAVPSGTIDIADVATGRYRTALVESRMVDVANADTNNVIKFKGRVSNIPRSNGGVANLECKSLSAFGWNYGARTWTTRCTVPFAGPDCGVTPTQINGTVNVVTDASVFTVTFTDAGKTDLKYFKGAIKITSGPNAGIARIIRRYTAATDKVELWEPFPSTVSNGDGMTIVRGCDKVFASGCTANANTARFWGVNFNISDFIALDDGGGA